MDQADRARTLPAREAGRRTPSGHEDPVALSRRPNNRSLLFEEETFSRAA
jgi:hypothetical protein